MCVCVGGGMDVGEGGNIILLQCVGVGMVGEGGG